MNVESVLNEMGCSGRVLMTKLRTKWLCRELTTNVGKYELHTEAAVLGPQLQSKRTCEAVVTGETLTGLNSTKDIFSNAISFVAQVFKVEVTSLSISTTGKSMNENAEQSMITWSIRDSSLSSLVSFPAPRSVSKLLKIAMLAGLRACLVFQWKISNWWF